MLIELSQPIKTHNPFAIASATVWLSAERKATDVHPQSLPFKLAERTDFFPLLVSFRTCKMTFPLALSRSVALLTA